MTYQYEAGKEYKTLGGYVATILDVNYKGGGSFKIAGKINKNSREYLVTWQSDGSYNILKDQHPYDLLPPVKTTEAWVNVYTYPDGIWAHNERTIADERAGRDRIGLLKITITGDEFDVEKVEI